MEKVNRQELERRIDILQSTLLKTETRMLKMQSERVELKQTLTHLHNLQKQEELILQKYETPKW